MRPKAIGSRLATLVLGGLAALACVVGASWATSQAAPTNSSEPKISGSAVVGRTLTASNGTWTGSPTSFSYQWVRCPKDGGEPDGSDCAAIGGATTKSYVVAGGDVGRRLRARVTATNADGSRTVASNPSAVVVRAGTVTNTDPPTVGGSATVGSTLTADPGTWEGDNLRFAYTWRRCNANGGACAAITGATEKTYVVQSADRGGTLRVRVVARNDDGSAAATSAPTARVTTASSPGAQGCPAGNGTIDVARLDSPARLLVDRQQLAPEVVRRDTGTLTVRFHVSACGGRSVQGALVYVTAVPFNQFSVPPEQRTGADGWATLTMRQLRGFPAADAQQLLVLFVRARKGDGNVLGGISTRRLVSFPVRLRG